MKKDYLESRIVRKKAVFLLFLVLFMLRLFHINAPMVDHHSWNQVSAASMAKHLYHDWSTFFRPSVDLYPSLESTSTVYAQEMPLYHVPIALSYYLFGISEWPGRLVSIVYGMIGLWYWFLLSRRLFGDKLAILSVLLAGLSPLNWYYHQSIMTDNSMVTAMIIGFYYFYLWLEENKTEKYFWYSLLWTALGGLFKAYALVIGVGYFLLILFRKEYSLLKSPKLYFFGILAWLPSILWIYHVQGLGEGRSEFSNVNSILHPELLWSWKFYQRIFFARLIDQLLTPWIAIFCMIGIHQCRISEKKFHPLLAWLGTCLIYLIIVQRGNYVHDYYQLIFVPGLTLFAAIGILRFWNWNFLGLFYRKLCLLSISFLFLLQSSIYTYNHTRSDIGSYQTGKKISELSQTINEKALAFDIGANKRNQLIYYSNLKGWFTPDLNMEKLEQYRSHGASWLGVNLLQESHFRNYQNFLQQVEKKYQKVWENRASVDRYGRSVISQVYDLRGTRF
ncbi:MAG: glycosyltransferase family 39 protein [SAR324 cluster bacterium]|nr:glycosyltransferase family 39 protein [SAR324 cluster bacterium]